MNFKVERKSGLFRIEEKDSSRNLNSENSVDFNNKSGKFCLACKMYHSYIKQDQQLCIACTKRLNLTR